ncbi:Flagellar hook-associated protein 1 [bacterium HR21]|nr:Flagellar hook-associated protein 1 [bacterium HR21]
MSLRALHTARSGLLAQQRALDVTSGNVANVNTPGYARRRITITPIVPERGHLGTGVRADRVVSFRSQYLDAAVRDFTSRHARSQTDALVFQQLSAVLGEPQSETGLNALLGRFFDALQQLVLRPEDIALRELFLQRAEDIAAAFRRLGEQLQRQRTELVQHLQQQVEHLNPLLERLAELNRQRALAPEGSEQALALADEQARVLEELSRLVPVTVAQDSRGMLTVSLAGHVVVEGEVALRVQLQTRRAGLSDEQHTVLQLVEASGKVLAELSPTGGELGSLLWHVNVTLDPEEQSGEFSLPRELNRFVARWVERVNGILAQGYGLDDGAGPPPGRRLFEGETMQTLRLSGDVVGNPRALPLSEAPAQPGNSTIAQRLLALAEDRSFADGMTPQGFSAAVLSRLGELHARSSSQEEWLQASLQQLEAQRQALSGVNLDEEATNLIRYQKAYEASARVLSVAASLLDTLIRIGT